MCGMSWCTPLQGPAQLYRRGSVPCLIHVQVHELERSPHPPSVKQMCKNLVCFQHQFTFHTLGDRTWRPEHVPSSHSTGTGVEMFRIEHHAKDALMTLKMQKKWSDPRISGAGLDLLDMMTCRISLQEVGRVQDPACYHHSSARPLLLGLGPKIWSLQWWGSSFVYIITRYK